jgi:uncharacterized membrane protein
VEDGIYLFDGPPPSINPLGVIVGTAYIYDPNYTENGFLREPNGTITTVDVPGSTYTEVLAINAGGIIIGDYGTPTAIYLGFFRSPDGNFNTFDIPGVVIDDIPTCINPAGAIAGEYSDANDVTHGFVRSPNGTIGTFEAPGSAFLQVYAIDPAGTVTGYWATTGIFHGFLRYADGTFTTFEVPTSTGTLSTAISSAGTVAGSYFDADEVYHGFLFFPGVERGSTPKD